MAYESRETKDACAPRSQSLPPREQKVIGLYYYQEATMKQIGAEIGVNESRVSQLHARAIRRLRDALRAGCRRRSGVGDAHRDPRVPAEAADGQGHARTGPRSRQATTACAPGVVVPYASVSRTARSKSDSRNGLTSQRQPLSARKRSASVPARRR